MKFTKWQRVQFKTAKEFEQEFGKDWKGKIYKARNSKWKMDHLHGTYATISDIMWLEVTLVDITTNGNVSWSYSTDMIKLVEEFVRGERVLVRYSDNYPREERIYLTTIEWANDWEYITVAHYDEERFFNGEPFDFYWENQIKKLPAKEKMTLAEVCEELGRDIEIIPE